MSKPTLSKLNVGEYNHQLAQGNAVDFLGAINSAGGSDSVAVGQTSKVVTHGLKDASSGANLTPSRIIITPTADPQQRYWVSARTSTTFTVTVAAVIAGSPFSFEYRAYAAD